MRLHELRATAFGPFADTVCVDFDALSESGLFLLTGATGAGKTSILDAVCFALYGEVPGDRQSAKRLRSDHAEPGVRPEVRLEATLAGRRFRIVRSPAWERAKKRGTGTTLEQASVTIAERRDGEWLPLSTRIDETGHLVGQLVGMNLSQFCQVALLPQGRFQAFLRARSEERHTLLQQLFRTTRFEGIERWVRDRRLELRRESEVAHQSVADLVSRISEATDTVLPEGWDIRDLGAPFDDGRLVAWAEVLVRAAEGRAAEGAAEAERAAEAEAASRRDLERGRTDLERRARIDAALDERADLAVDAERHESERRVLDAARRASVVAPVHRLAESSINARSRAHAHAETAAAQAVELLGLASADGAALDAAVARAVDAAAMVRAALPQEVRLREVREQIAEHESQLDDLADQQAEASQAHAALPQLLERVGAALERADAAAVRVPALSSRLEELRLQVQAAEELRTLTVELSEARAELDAASYVAQESREVWLNLREARLDGMAAEIAGALAVGACCPVCGSADHPHKAGSRPGAPSGADEAAALKALDDAKVAELAHDQRVRDLTTRLAVVSDRAGDGVPEELATELRQGEAELARLASLAAEADRIRRDVTGTETEKERLATELRAMRTRQADLLAALRTRRHEERSLRTQLAELLEGSGTDDLEELLERHLAHAAAGREAFQAVAERDAADRAWAEALAALETAAREAGFESVDDAIEAIREPAEVQRLHARVTEHERRLAAVAEVLEQPGVDELLAAAPPDVEALAAAHEKAMAQLADAGARASLWSGRAQRLGALVASLERALEGWAPVRSELELATRLAAFLEGKSPDNRLQMRLSAYVLAHRLAQVVAAANERLARMSDQRYSLEHTGQKGAGESRGGLSLLVRDDWSGETRDPATLSGGETFVVSLALALGLADVIAHEVGGTDLDTLFVDEGFGSLDADTLDDVMDTLDTLRDGGRVVGVVSHVAEMRDRIPAQLHVAKRRHGSSVKLVRTG
jgi:exonuclease SbcC